MFYFKKFISTFFFPLSLCLEVIVGGLLFLWLTKKQKTGKIIVTCGVLLLIVFSYGIFTDSAVQSLENMYPPLLTHEEDIDQYFQDPVKWIVVLGGGTTNNDDLPPLNQLSKATLIRLVEGIRLHKLMPGSKLVLTGKGSMSVTTAEIMAQTALCLGVDDTNIVLEKESMDTKDHALYLKHILKDDQFIVVTDASHMLRAMLLFKKQGMNPIAAPTSHMIKGPPGKSPRRFFPNAYRILRAERLIYEYLGIAWAKIRGQI